MGVREQILAIKPKTATVSFPDLDGLTVTVRGMTGRERMAFELANYEGHGKTREFNPTRVRERLVAYCCIDEQGQRVFSDEDIEALTETRWDVLDRIASVALELSGIGPAETELGKPSASQTVLNTSSSVSPPN